MSQTSVVTDRCPPTPNRGAHRLMRQLSFWRDSKPAEAPWVMPWQQSSSADTAPSLRLNGPEDLPHTARWLSAQLATPVQLTLTSNRTTMVSYRCTEQGIKLRLHRIFLEADVRHIEHVVAFVRGDKAAARRLDAFIDAHAHLVDDGIGFPIRTEGVTHDLQQLFNTVNGQYFHGACAARVTWSPPARGRRHKSIRLGLYVPHHALICVNPCLDQPWVPGYYLAWVLFHEMLHELYGISHDGRRRIAHSRELRAIEGSHPDYAKCKRWEQEYFTELLRSRPPAARHGTLRVAPKTMPQ